MFSLTWKFPCSVNTERQAPVSAAGVQTDRLYSRDLWHQWQADSTLAHANWSYDFAIDTSIDNILIYNHNLSLTGRVRLQLYDGSNSLIFDQEWGSGRLSSGFGLGSFGLAGFGGVLNHDADLTPYPFFFKTFARKEARYASISIIDPSTRLQIGFMSVGTSFSPIECSVESVSISYISTTTQNQSLSGTIHGVAGPTLRRIDLTLQLLHTSDLSEFVALTNNNNISQPLFFTMVRENLDNLNQSSDSHLKVMRDILSVMVYLNQEQLPSYRLFSGTTSEVNLSLLESM